MSEEQHAQDLKSLKGKHLKVGEACLNRHVGYYADGNTCSYRGQGRKRAQTDSSLYDWPAYRDLSRRRKAIETAAKKEGGKTVPDWYTLELKPPRQGDWDVGRDGNFKYKCYIPYWHEAHHILPNSTVRAAIAAVGQGTANPTKMVLAVRGGLLDEGYNLNNTVNMIILPMDREVALALGLPKHRKTKDIQSHSGYSKHVRLRLDKIFGKIREASKKHKAPDYSACKEQLEALSAELRQKIIDAGQEMKQAAAKRDALDDMREDEFKPSEPKKPAKSTKPKKTSASEL